jgi:hypothetical protein
MTDRKSRHRLSKLEKLVSTAVKEREEREKQAVKELPFHSQRHATAVAAIVLSGQPKIDEPLIRAWARALQHYGIDVNVLGGMGDQVRAAQRLLPKIIGGEDSSARFTQIFSTAPVWLLQFTGISMDSRLLKFHVPDISQRLRWGSAGFEDARRWPLLPSGVMTAGNPITDNDPRQLWLIPFCIMTVGDPIQAFENRLSLEKEETRYRAIDPLIDDIFFALNLDGKPEEEWSGYEKRRIRRLAERFSHFQEDRVRREQEREQRERKREQEGIDKKAKRNRKEEEKAFGELLGQYPKGMTSYFMWLAERHPASFAALLGRAMPQIMQQHAQGADAFEAMLTAEEIDAFLSARNMPTLQQAFQLPKRIDLKNPPTIDVTPEQPEQQ